MAAQSASLGSANATVAIATDVAATLTQAQTSSAGVLAHLFAGNLVATLAFEATVDGANWFAVAGYPLLASGVYGSPVISTAGGTSGQFFIPVSGYAAVRVRASAYTSGSGVVVLDAAAGIGGQLFANLEGLKPTYFAGLGANTPAATPTDVAVLFGNAAKTVKVTAIRLSVEATAAGLVQFDLVKRIAGTQSAVNTAFAANTHAGLMDSADAASATITGGLSGVYTGNPASLGTLSGIIDSKTVTVLANAMNVIEWQFGNGRPARCPTLRGVTQLLAINGAGHTLLAGEKFGVSFEWTEE